MCRETNLKIKPEKTKFFQTEVTYLGHNISTKGVSPDPQKYSAITNYPRPTTAKEVKQFVAFCNYYRKFIKNFSTITAPLNELTKKGATFKCDNNHEKIFGSLKYKLTNPPILKFPNFKKKFILTSYNRRKYDRVWRCFIPNRLLW